MTEALQEFVDSSATSLRVDRQQGILRGVKLIGLTSRNGRQYKPEALVGAKSLYEGAKVNVNHPKGGPLSPRDYQDRLGIIREVNFRAGLGLFGDLHFNPKHPLAEQLVWDAEHNPRNVGISHNVLARVSKDGEQTLVEEITHVQSVDLVADPAATRGLYEQQAETLSWEALSVESLDQNRPDLTEVIRQLGRRELQEQVQELKSDTDQLERRNRALQLLCEHGLALESPTPMTRGSDATLLPRVSSAFYEMLVGTEDRALQEELVRERAELVSAKTDASQSGRFDRPSSRDQLSLASLHGPRPHNSAEFAKALKVVSA